jgi:uncharacterized protein (TIGR02391 family)
MSKKLLELTSEELLSLPIDQIAMIALRHIHSTPEWSSRNFIVLSTHQGLSNEAKQCWAEALNWLVSKNLVAQPSAESKGEPGTIFVTRLGKAALETGLAAIKASERLGCDLHPRLERVRSQFLLGEYELGAFAAMREVEIRVRELSGASPSLVGVKLMRDAFRDGGRLSNIDLDPGERVGLMELFAGAIGTFKNPPSHRQVDYADPTEASEVILLADLLMRLLDRSQQFK